ncbi:MAG: hypothetical protein KIG52_10455 [Muribaculaceae bacterium]|nr:hypothetical protein [Muribaculaceae bacterium]
MKRFICTVFTALVVLVSALCLTAGEKYRVTANYAVIYDAEQPVEELGRMNRGERFEVIGKNGNRLILNYKGKKGLIAPYHCEPMPEPAPAAQNVSTQPHESASPATTATQDADEQQKPKNYFKWLDTFLNAIRSDNSATEMPREVAYILAFFMFLGLIIGAWAVFGKASCDRFINNLAQYPVTRCSKLTHFRPIIPLLLGGMAGNLTNNIVIAFAVAGIYEFIIISRRASALGSIRAALVEAFYIFSYAIGALFFCYILIIFFFLASGGTTSGSGSDSGKKKSDRCCNNCSLWNSSTHRCGRYGHVTNQSECCNGHIWG